MPCCNNNNSFYHTIGRLVSFLLIFLSFFVIVFSFSNKRKYISQERLRCSYDGLSPRDYK